MARWFTSDLHLSHVRILELEPRGHADVDAMNAAVIDALNSTLAPTDELWVVGDLALGRIAESLLLAALIRARVILIGGNHDRFHPSNRKAAEWLEKYAALPNVVAVHPTDVATTLADGTPVTVCHFPYPPDARPVTHRDGTVTDDMFDPWRPVDEGGWLIHGHVHGQWRQNDRQINVGMDAWGGAAVSEETLVDLVRSGPQQLPSLPWPEAQRNVTLAGARPAASPAGPRLSV